MTPDDILIIIFAILIIAEAIMLIYFIYGEYRYRQFQKECGRLIHGVIEQHLELIEEAYRKKP